MVGNNWFKEAWCLWVLLSVTVVPALSQVQDETGSILVKNYSSKDYQASFSNFRIQQDDRGLLYVGNVEGLLEYDGVTWRKIEHSSTPITALCARKPGQLLAGTVRDLGLINADRHGRAFYHSLSETFGHDFSTIWGITRLKDQLYLYTKPAIIGIDNMTTVKSWSAAPGEIYQSKLHVLGNSIYCAKQQSGLVKLTPSGHMLLPGTEILGSQPISVIDSLGDGLLIGTRYNGFYQYQNNQLLQVQGEAHDFAMDYQLFDYVKLDSSYLLASFTGGLVLTDSQLGIKNIINEHTGLQNNIVKDVSLDHEKNAWCALQQGIAQLKLNPWRQWAETNGLEGTPWDILRFESKLYVGTTKGVYFLDKNTFKKIEGINSRVWKLTQYNDQLLAATEEGVVVITNYKATPHPDLQRLIATELYVMQNNHLLIGHTRGLQLWNDTTFKSIDLSTTNNDLFFQNFMQEDGSVWVTLKNRGLYRIDSIDSPHPDITRYEMSRGQPGLTPPNTLSLNGKIHSTAADGLFYYDAENNRFTKSELLSGMNLTSHARVNDSTYYMVMKSADNVSQVHKIIFRSPDDMEIIAIPYRGLRTSDIIAVYPEPNGHAWFATSDGLFRFDENIKKDYNRPYNTLVRKVSSSDSTIFYGTYSISTPTSGLPTIVLDQPDTYKPTLSYLNNNISFEYAATSYELPEENHFSYYLENNDRGWSPWSKDTKKEYNNLAPGRYTFYVKSKNIYDNIGRTASYEFTVLPPWYQTTWAIMLWVILVILFVWFITLAYSYRLRKQRQKLKLIVADRTFEVLSQKKEIEKQNEQLITQRDEITKQHDDIQEKNLQLEISQEEILTINEQLQELNIHLEGKVEERTAEIKNALKRLKQTNEELDTFIYRTSHDLKGPISRIIGLTTLAKMEDSGSINGQYYDLIEVVTRNLNHLLDKLAEVHEIFNRTPTAESIDIQAIINEIREELNDLDPGNTRFTFDAEEGATIESDHYLIKLIIKNLLENAYIFRKIMVEHHISVSCKPSGNGYTIEIHDTGTGIDPKVVGKIFTMFYRASDQAKGSGLGLYLVKLAVEKLGGDILVKTEKAHFTNFIINLPGQPPTT